MMKRDRAGHSKGQEGFPTDKVTSRRSHGRTAFMWSITSKSSPEWNWGKKYKGTSSCSGSHICDERPYSAVQAWLLTTRSLSRRHQVWEREITITLLPPSWKIQLTHSPARRLVVQPGSYHAVARIPWYQRESEFRYSLYRSL